MLSWNDFNSKKMRKIIVLSFMSLDGVIQAPGGPEEDTSGGFQFGGWVVPYFDEAAGNIMEKQMSGHSDLLLGRKTYEIFASYWPDHADQWPGINQVTKYVASNTLKEAKWNNSVILKGNVEDQLRNIKQQDGPDLQVHGSAQFIQTLLKNDLVDELWLKIFPVTLGKGKRLFDNGSIPARFRLTESKVTPAGVITANYERDGEVSTGLIGG
jgi:dihydrofolate reductase